VVTDPILSRTYSPDAVKKEYARVAWFYDLWGRLTEDKALVRLLELAEVEDGCLALEVGVGTGRLFAELVRRNPTGRNEGIDLSPHMLYRARRRLARLAPASSYRLQEASAYDLPFESASFDVLFNAFMLDLLPVDDFPRVIGEFERVLRPGGKAAVAYFSHGVKRAHRFWCWTAKHFPALLTGCRPVRLEAPLRKLGLRILRHEEISQNTFPSAIVIAQKAT
jgi:ubiquinone/menaquinone biosynthesis C-methylase UbiE